MQTLRDAAILLVLIVMIGSVRVTDRPETAADPLPAKPAPMQLSVGPGLTPALPGLVIPEETAAEAAEQLDCPSFSVPFGVGLDSTEHVIVLEVNAANRRVSS